MIDEDTLNGAIEQLQHENKELKKQLEMYKDNAEYEKNRAESIKELFILTNKQLKEYKKMYENMKRDLTRKIQKQKASYKKLKDKYEKTINLLVDDTDILPCENFDDFDEKYCEEKCGEGYKKCWKHYIENCYKGENK